MNLLMRDFKTRVRRGLRWRLMRAWARWLEHDRRGLLESVNGKPMGTAWKP